MSDEKTEKPTKKKFDDARDEGHVAVSKDLAHLIIMVIVAEVAFSTEPLWHGAIDQLFDLSIQSVGRPFDASLARITDAAGRLLLIVFGACLVICSVACAGAFWGQFGVLIAPEALTPKLDKLNPVNGIKQLFSKEKLVEISMSLVKAPLICLVMFIMVRDQLPNIVQLAAGAPKDAYAACLSLIHSMLHVVAGIILVIGLIDFALHKFVHADSLKMDKEEVKREYKEMQGDPMVKGKRKQLSREFAMEGPKSKTKEANAVVVNPTHFAVAMLFDETTPVPIVLAKGRDDIAFAMIEQARESGIPVIRHVWLARTLYATCREDSVVPKSSYEAVAHVYAVVQELRNANELARVFEIERYGDPSSMA